MYFSMINDTQLMLKDDKWLCVLFSQLQYDMIHYPFLLSDLNMIFHYGEADKTS